MAFYSYIFSANYKRFFQNLKGVCQREKKFLPFLTLDAAWCVFRYGLALTDYLNYEIYRRDSAQRREYVGVKIQNTLYEQVSPSRYKQRYTVKPTFLKEFRAYTQRDFVVPGEGNFPELERFLDSHSRFMIKPYDGLGGRDVRRMESASITDREAFFQKCIRERLFLEELVIQHPQLNVLCGACVNTMRVMTFNDHGKPEILWMGLRIGNGTNDVDNFHAQGMACAVDIQTGRLVGNAVNKDGRHFEKHPISGIVFRDFQLPDFEKAKQLVLQACLESDKILVVGWDVAFSENGPVIIEGNRRPGFDLVQMIDGRGRMDMVRDLMERTKDRT